MLPKRDEVLAEMEDYASEHNVPIVGPAVARVLQQLALMINAKQFSSWVQPSDTRPSGGRKRWAKKAGSSTRTAIPRMPSAPAVISIALAFPIASRVHTGDALEVLSEQKQQYDIIFNDVDKEDYPRVLRLVSPRLRKGGLFITDNVLWSGRVAEKNPQDPTTKAILEFNRLLYNSGDFFTTILPIRDGLAVALKK